jgi:cytochrome c biogenesis protein CcmG/thiol:disulfide interchange protein DsbE
MVRTLPHRDAAAATSRRGVHGPAVILGVASNDDHDDARRFLEDLGIDYPNVFDASGDIRVSLDLTAYPTTYVFSAEGELTARIVGGVSEQHLAALIEDTLR